VTVRVIVVSDDPLVRGGLAALLSAESGLIVSGQWPFEAVRDAEDAEAAVWDADGSPASLDHLEAAQSGGLAVLAVLRDAAQAGPALAAGARGVVPRDVSGARLAAAVRAVAEGLMVLDASAAEALLRSRPEPAPLVEALTAREQEVLQLVAEGLSNKLIAARLAISEHTAKFHVNAILGKLGAQTRAEAVAQAARLGLLLL
jgi:two-component system, NarL family, nitrate/nitrite response regulator NarL